MQISGLGVAEESSEASRPQRDRRNFGWLAAYRTAPMSADPSISVARIGFTFGAALRQPSQRLASFYDVLLEAID